MTAAVSKLHRSRRQGTFLETVLRRALGLTTMLFALSYAGALVFLLFRGAHRIFSFTSFATPLAGIAGEEAMRIVVGLVLFGSLAWAVGQGVDRVFHRLPRRISRLIRVSLFVIAGTLAVAVRDHLPRFLVSLPSETHAGGGVGPEIFNTLYFAVLSTTITIPIGVGASVYIARFAKNKQFVRIVRTALDTLASLPSIVYGLFGFLVFVVQMRAGYSIFAGAFVLALLNLPLVVGITEESLAGVPRELEEASLALGATAVQTVMRVTLPYAWPGILSAVVLSIGRVFAESAPLIMTAGTTISRANAYSLDPFRGGETLAVHLWYVNSAGLSPDKADVSAGTAAVLVLLIFLTNTLAARLGRFGGAKGSRTKRATR